MSMLEKIQGFISGKSSHKLHEEYIRKIEDKFNLEHKNIQKLSKLELNEYVCYLDGLWQN